ncbi:MAG: glycosyl hydrolase, partial [Melioribacteraceae bacterium]
AKTVEGLKLRTIGPAFCSGRIGDLAVNPDKPNEYYAAVASGGVWKTTNAGISWEPVFENEGSYSIGCVTLDPNNPHVVWVGTGENNSQRSVGYGDGIYKSEDGGKNWKNMGLKNSEHIAKIVIDPRNSNVIYVAAQGPLWGPGGDRGLYKSTDGGETWNKVLEISENTGITDLVYDPRNPDVMYAASYQRRRHVWTLINGGPESAIYKSTNAGAAWNKIETGLPKGDIGRIGLAISPVNPDVLYAIIEAEEDKGGFFRSTDRGASWEKRSGKVSSSPQYYQEIVCDLLDVDKVYCLDTYTSVTEDGGKTFKRLGNNNRHVDDHALWIDPNNTNHLLIGGDGGIYETYDGGELWDYKDNLPVTQFYKVSTDNNEPFYYVWGGTQDNNSMGGPSQTLNEVGIVNADWYVTQGGDGYESQVDPVDPNIVYAQYQHGGLTRYNKVTGENIDIQPKEGKGEEAYRWNWDTPLVLSPHKHTRLYFAANVLFKSEDMGNSWEKISGDLTRQLDRDKLEVMGKIWSADAVAKNKSTSYYGNIIALNESPIKEGLIYTGSDDGLINVTEDGGKNWRKIEKFPGVPERTYVNMIVASYHDVNRVYVAFNNHKNADFKPYLLRSDDAGKTWKSIAGNLPERGSVYSVAEDHVNPNLLFAGTEFGIFFTVDGGNKWIQLKGNMPTIAVRDI